MLKGTFPSNNEFNDLKEKYNVIPVCREILADMETPVSLISKFYDEDDPIFLFESVEGGERWGRYSFIGTSAKSHLKVFKNDIEITQGDETNRIPHNGDPLGELRTIMEKYRAAEVKGLPRFFGGLVGYLTYEMVSFFEKIENKLPDDKPLAHFIIPDELIVFDNIRNTLTAIVLAFTDDCDEKLFERSHGKLNKMLSVINGEMPKRTSLNGKDYKLTPRYSEEEYRQKVSKVKSYIQDGEIIQTVISQPFDCEETPDLIELYRAQRFINPSPYLYFMHFCDTALIGSSPETMVRLENGVATLRPIAGTRHRGDNEKEDRELADDLLKDEKERAEHLMLVDLGRNDLGRVALTGSVQVTDLMFVERYSHVMHLVSNIRCDMKEDMDAYELLKSSFPAGTLSGAPKVRAMEIISELEEEARGPYGGAVGYISFNGDMDFAIVIRTACVEDGKLTVRAGAGLVADSDPEKERVETVNKAKALQKALKLVTDMNNGDR
jgi:anthranilate synthase component 1